MSGEVFDESGPFGPCAPLGFGLVARAQRNDHLPFAVVLADVFRDVDAQRVRVSTLGKSRNFCHFIHAPIVAPDRSKFVKNLLLLLCKLEINDLSANGGAEGNRTPDLCSAIAALSHLSYGPEP